MSCHKASSMCNFDTYSTTPIPECCSDHLIQMMHYLAELFEEEKIKYWAHFGTLLGGVREKSIIPWDSDVDFGLLIEDREHVYSLLDHITSDGFAYCELDKNLLQITYSPTNLISCDLWFHETITAMEHIGTNVTVPLIDPIDLKLESDEPILRCNVYWAQYNHTTNFPKWFIDELWEMPINNKLIKCPRFPSKFVQLIYGPNWQEPDTKKNYNDYSVPGNYYALSKWLQVVSIKKTQKYLPKPTIDFIEVPHCRQDTPECKSTNNCCLLHIKELMSYAEFILEENSIPYQLYNNKTIYLDPADYSKLMNISKNFNNYGYEFKSINRNYCIINYSKINKNLINLVFSLNYKKYINSDNDIKNKEVLSWAYNALIKTIDNYEYQAHISLTDESTQKDGRYSFVSYNINWFIHYLHGALKVCQFLKPKKTTFKFLEIGCGVGTKTKIANSIFDAYGLEVFEPYAEYAKDLLKNRVKRNFGIYKEEVGTERIITEDALQYEQYNEYDVIYFYCPFDDFEKEVELEEKIYKEVKKGTVIIPIWKQANLPEYIMKTSCPSGEIYIKSPNQNYFNKLENFISESI
jgi:protein-L-isoaspartate O-methyltransferase